MTAALVSMSSSSATPSRSPSARPCYAADCDRPLTEAGRAAAEELAVRARASASITADLLARPTRAPSRPSRRIARLTPPGDVASWPTCASAACRARRPIDGWRATLSARLGRMPDFAHARCRDRARDAQRRGRRHRSTCCDPAATLTGGGLVRGEPRQPHLASSSRRSSPPIGGDVPPRHAEPRRVSARPRWHCAGEVTGGHGFVAGRGPPAEAALTRRGRSRPRASPAGGSSRSAPPGDHGLRRAAAARCSPTPWPPRRHPTSPIAEQRALPRRQAPGRRPRARTSPASQTGPARSTRPAVRGECYAPRTHATPGGGRRTASGAG